MDESAGIFAKTLGGSFSVACFSIVVSFLKVKCLSALFGSSEQDESPKKKWSWTEGATNFVKDCGNMFSKMIG